MADSPDSFTDQALKALGIARAKAAHYEHDHIGPVHLLFASVDVMSASQPQALEAVGVDAAAVKAAAVQVLSGGPKNATPADQLPFTANAQEILGLAKEEAGGQEIGPEHILRGVARKGEGYAARVLTENGVSLERVLQ